MFKLTSSFLPTGDQPQAIEKLVKSIEKKLKNQVLLGVTGSGKTFTMANVIQKTQLPTLIISHNKTLAGQLYQEFRDFFPENAVSYFISYYDYYQPEAYIPTTDTYIEKEAQINELIDKLRLQSTTNILTRKDVIVVASVSCIYNIGSPAEYGKFILELEVGQEVDQKSILKRLTELQYERSEFEFKRGTFRVRGERIDIYPAYEDFGYSVLIDSSKVKKFEKFDPLTGGRITNVQKLIIYPAKHYMMDPDVFGSVEQQIRGDLKKESEQLKKQNKLIEMQRLIQRVNYDLEMIKEVGYVNGIENYSRYFDGRSIGDPPYSLVDYFKETYKDNWLLFIDESHMTVPQLRGMYNGDHSRKKTLIEFGFRLKASLDNRPLKFEEFYPMASKMIYVSATPDEWELKRSQVAEQLIRPTGIIDPQIIIRKATGEIPDLVKEIEIRAKKGDKVLVTTLTKKTAEDLSSYLKEKNIRASYLHSDIKTLERSDILDNLRKGEFDVLIGVNLLREGLDLPEVSLVAILDADKEGFLRSKTSLVQTMGRAARNITSQVILYADTITKSIKQAVSEIERRRRYQTDYNKKHNITPRTIYKPIRERIIDKEQEALLFDRPFDHDYLKNLKPESLTPYDKKKTIKKLEQEMKRQAEELNFELAIKIREKVKQLNG
ncbi:MAG: UvrABC system protein B [Candidatus Roizmanbacteria bacterium GW2011_GWC2_37_13]|uniref:UvrABC system protein B n=1 Tax=Candidatus Roizmanbacteria bacterium GW2011_GWC2_37_13 TaxID=1618486 RepID=A0A0G0G3W0_9BACT|nr:MAG: UvrABC system protein B [Candidatus Roizmanbacteria bacterium GW2011_GWC1_37_12]KKQ24722.1 MAG: UvrABC system protein B [Candidatus Roizmanbacteria bacterium GW2011_GWC2_37_13]